MDGIKKFRSTSFRLGEEDRKAIAAIKNHYGIITDNDAVRIALRELYRIIQHKEQGGTNNHAT